MKQGDVYWYTFKHPDKRRPVVIITRDGAISGLSSITVALITTTIRSIPTEIFLSPDDGMFEACVVNVDNIQTVEKRKLERFIAHLSDDLMAEICRAIQFALGFDRYLDSDNE
jgi:mRNA interferase MazF